MNNSKGLDTPQWKFLRAINGVSAIYGLGNVVPMFLDADTINWINAGFRLDNNSLMIGGRKFVFYDIDKVKEESSGKFDYEPYIKDTKL